ncbi:putative proton/sugar symporter [Azorhizobium caulinodans ORS 571]|uniref:Putative proton/sugar symporter n=1 Tax=Azorhizobium caulinodans (strain ATCC 43989 / DSM 5975 / JCM 20966 / LMG 6465 / NBRC 14845 / NCIMB 13405 / ORS 571) TaxID=438753 RepID=A8I852_AZOC5|nr:MFS transporter [Azorhizobium caulinodans]BAF88209.1 putative proton/sugar symporter [Azorhizobium caulinodans ORS 571]
MSGEGQERVRLALPAAYAGLFFALGVYMPFFPLWLGERGLSPGEIGTALAVPLTTRLLATPILGWLSDRIGKPRAVLLLLAALTLLVMSALVLASGAVAIFLILGLAAMAWNPSFPLLDAYASRQARAKRVDYGRSRMWGSASFILANLLGGWLVGAAGAGVTVPLMLAGHAAFLLTLVMLPEMPRPPAAAGLHVSVPRARTALVIGILAAASVQASHAVLYAFGSVTWQKQGLSLGTIGMLWALGVVSEIVLFHFGTRVLRRLPPALLLAIGGAAAMVRFGAMTFDLPLALLLPLQLLHGATFGATYLGLVELVARAVPEHRAATVQSLAGWTVSLAMAAASVASGPLFQAFGANAFYLSVALGAVGLVAALASAALQPQRSGVGG